MATCFLRQTRIPARMTSRTLGIFLVASVACMAQPANEGTGTYSAVVDLGEEPAQLCLAVSATGYTTGTVMYQRQRHTIRGDVTSLSVSSHGQRLPLRMIPPHGGE